MSHAGRTEGDRSHVSLLPERERNAALVTGEGRPEERPPEDRGGAFTAEPPHARRRVVAAGHGEGALQGAGEAGAGGLTAEGGDASGVRHHGRTGALAIGAVRRQVPRGAAAAEEAAGDSCDCADPAGGRQSAWGRGGWGVLCRLDVFSWMFGWGWARAQVDSRASWTGRGSSSRSVRMLPGLTWMTCSASAVCTAVPSAGDAPLCSDR